MDSPEDLELEDPDKPSETTGKEHSTKAPEYRHLLEDYSRSFNRSAYTTGYAAGIAQPLQYCLALSQDTNGAIDANAAQNSRFNVDSSPSHTTPFLSGHTGSTFHFSIGMQPDNAPYSSLSPQWLGEEPSGHIGQITPGNIQSNHTSNGALVPGSSHDAQFVLTPSSRHPLQHHAGWIEASHENSLGQMIPTSQAIPTENQILGYQNSLNEPLQHLEAIERCHHQPPESLSLFNFHYGSPDIGRGTKRHIEPLLDGRLESQDSSQFMNALPSSPGVAFRAGLPGDASLPHARPESIGKGVSSYSTGPNRRDSVATPMDSTSHAVHLGTNIPLMDWTSAPKQGDRQGTPFTNRNLPRAQQVADPGSTCRILQEPSTGLRSINHTGLEQPITMAL